jgi:hypothetical protein
MQASAVTSPEDLASPAVPAYKPITKVKPYRGAGHKPVHKVRASSAGIYGWTGRYRCMLPKPKNKGWNMEAQVIFARTKGKVRYTRGGNVGYNWQQGWDVDLNSQMGVPDHAAVPEFAASYRFRPRWALKYTIMPVVASGEAASGWGYGGGNQFYFGNHSYNTGQGTQVKWERLVQTCGLTYDPITTPNARVSIFASYVRVDDKLAVRQQNSSDTMYTDLNMAMTGLEYEKCLKTARFRNTLSLKCRAGVAFLDEAFGGDLSTGVRYSVPLGSGRMGYLEGGYRFMTYKKGFSDVHSWDTATEGGYVQMGFVF